MILWDIEDTSHTQFFGDFGILLGIHHPKTNVFVLQDLRCELGVHTNKSVSVKGRKSSNSETVKNSESGQKSRGPWVPVNVLSSSACISKYRYLSASAALQDQNE